MNILVTGGCGFIGSHIVDEYIRLGHRVTVIDNLSTGDRSNLNSGAIFHERDIQDPGVEQIFTAGKFDAVNHHAAQINVRTSIENPLFDAQVNIMGSLNLLQHAARTCVKRFIFASSGGTVYGEPDRYPITEDFPIRPTSPYGIAKVAVERYLHFFTFVCGLSSVILRYSNVYGPRQISKSEAGVVSIFINQILQNKPCDVFGDGSQTRDYVFVEDIVKANVNALSSSSTVVNIGTGIETSVNDLVRILSGITGHRVEHTFSAARPGEVARNSLSSAKAQSDIKWKPSVTFKDGVKRTFEYFQKISQA